MALGVVGRDVPVEADGLPADRERVGMGSGFAQVGAEPGERGREVGEVAGRTRGREVPAALHGFAADVEGVLGAPVQRAGRRRGR